MKGKVDERWNRRDVKRVRNGGKQGRLAIKKEKKKTKHAEQKERRTNENKCSKTSGNSVKYIRNPKK